MARVAKSQLRNSKSQSQIRRKNDKPIEATMLSLNPSPRLLHSWGHYTKRDAGVFVFKARMNFSRNFVRLYPSRGSASIHHSYTNFTHLCTTRVDIRTLVVLSRMFLRFGGSRTECSLRGPPFYSGKANRYPVVKFKELTWVVAWSLRSKLARRVDRHRFLLAGVQAR